MGEAVLTCAASLRIESDHTALDEQWRARAALREARSIMTAQLNHTIVWCRDKQRSAEFLAEMLGRPPPSAFGPFAVVELDNGVSLDFHDGVEDVTPQHYAFLIGEDDFDAVLGRIRDRGLEYWADPGRHRASQINRNDGGRGVYFPDPDGHLLEVITRPYGSGT